MWLLKKVDLVSAETVEMQQELSKKWQRKIAYVPNGFFNVKKTRVSYAAKRNRIITVGRIGAPEKSTDVLLQAFAAFAPDFPDWDLELVGPVESKFDTYIQLFFEKFPKLKNRVIFTGPVYDREQLLKRYAEAKIFCLTSKWESFGIASLEAGNAGCFMIISDISAALDITGNEAYGRIFPVGDVARLTGLLKEVAGNEKLMQQNCEAVQQYVDARFSWSTIVRQIDQLLKEGGQ